MNTLEQGRIITECNECENKTEVWDDDPRPLCEYCEHGDECEAPESIRFYLSTLAGNSCAYCRNCTYVSVYWECGCDLEHDCEGK